MERRLKVFGKEIVFKLESEADQSVFEEIFVDRDYRLLDPVIQKAGGLIIDAGAHIGCFSVYAAIQNSKVKILAYEPEERNFALLKENLRANGCRNVLCKNLAIGKSDGIRELFLNEDSHNHSFFGEGAAKKVNCTTLWKILNKVGVCDLVKMDVEGAEFEILANLDEDVFGKVRNFFVEYHEYGEGMKREKISEKLKGHGYRVQVFPSSYDERMGFVIALSENESETD